MVNPRFSSRQGGGITVGALLRDRPQYGGSYRESVGCRYPRVLGHLAHVAFRGYTLSVHQECPRVK
jgi:hypothetical protein